MREGRARDREPRTTIVSEMPGDHPQKRAIERVLLETMESVAGTWKVTLRSESSWWAISLERSDLVLRTLLHEGELDARFVGERLRQILRRHGLLEG